MPFSYYSWVILMHNTSPLIVGEGNLLTQTSIGFYKTYAKEIVVKKQKSNALMSMEPCMAKGIWWSCRWKKPNLSRVAKS
jgi:hypothetical protein